MKKVTLRVDTSRGTVKDWAGQSFDKISVVHGDSVLWCVIFEEADPDDPSTMSGMDLSGALALRFQARSSRVAVGPSKSSYGFQDAYNQGYWAEEALGTGRVSWLVPMTEAAIASDLGTTNEYVDGWIEFSWVDPNSQTQTLIQKEFRIYEQLDNGAAGSPPPASPTYLTAVEIAAAYVPKSLFDAQTILAATLDDTPAALTIAEQTLVGRITGGNVAALTATQVRTLLNVEDGADVTDATNVDAAGAVMNVDFDAQTILAATLDDTPAALTIAEQTLVGRITGGNVAALTAAQVKTLLAIAESDVSIDVLGSPTYSTAAHRTNVFGSAGLISGGAVTDAGGATVDVAALTGAIRTTDSAVGTLKSFDFAGTAGVAITANAVRYVGIEYNSGTPQVVVKTADDWNETDEFALASVVNESGTLHIWNNPQYAGDGIRRLIHRLYKTEPLGRGERIGGLILGETGTRNVTLSSGEIHDRLNEFSIAAIDTSGAGTFDLYYDDGAGGHTKVAAATQWPNTQYDDGSGTLADLTANRWGNIWFYVEPDGALVAQYGTSNAVSSEIASAEAPPSDVPNRIAYHSRLVGRIVFQKSASTGTVQSAFTTTFAATGVSEAVLQSDFDAQTILAATLDNTPAALTVAEQTLVGRITGGNVAALTAAQVRNLLSITGQYRTMYIPAASMFGRETNGAQSYEYEFATNDVNADLFLFDDTTEEAVQLFWRLPLESDVSHLKFKVDWTAIAGTAGAGDTVVWGVRAGSYGDGDALDAAFGTEQTVADDWQADGDDHLSAATAHVTASGSPAAGDLLCIQISRKPTDGSDDLTGDAALLGVWVQYKESSTSPSAW